MKARNVILTFAFSVATGLYTGFVLQNLWNWFLAPALHGAEVSYWQTYGIVLLVKLLFQHDTLQEETRWESAFKMLYAAVPGEQRPEIDRNMKDEAENVWMKVGFDIFGNLIGNTVTLGLGWTVHTVLM
jgi:hypothetical protein